MMTSFLPVKEDSLSRLLIPTQLPNRYNNTLILDGSLSFLNVGFHPHSKTLLRNPVLMSTHLLKVGSRRTELRFPFHF